MVARAVVVESVPSQAGHSAWICRGPPPLPRTRTAPVLQPARWRSRRCSAPPGRWPLCSPPRDTRFLSTTSPSSCAASLPPAAAEWRWWFCLCRGSLWRRSRPSGTGRYQTWDSSELGRGGATCQVMATSCFSVIPPSNSSNQHFPKFTHFPPQSVNYNARGVGNKSSAPWSWAAVDLDELAAVCRQE